MAYVNTPVVAPPVSGINIPTLPTSDNLPTEDDYGTKFVPPKGAYDTGQEEKEDPAKRAKFKSDLQAELETARQNAINNPSDPNAKPHFLFMQQMVRMEEMKKEDSEESKFDLKDMSLVLLAMGAGVNVVGAVDKLINGDDIEKLDVAEALFENTQAITDPKIRQMIINASYGDQGALASLENLSAYNTQFGSFSSDIFRGPNGQVLEGAYQEFIKNNPGIDRDQFLVEFAKQNPVSPITQEINEKLSRFGQIARGASEFGAIDRATIRQGMDDASKFYQPKAEGGFGYKASDFRSPEQQQVVDHALGLVNSPEARMLKGQVADRVGTQGRLGEDAMREITADSLGSVDPSLQAQPYLRSGGLAKTVINTENAQRKRMMEDENSLFQILQGERSYSGTLSNVVGQNTVDPVKAFGLQGSNTGAQADKTYSTTPTQGINYDPTSGFFGSVMNQNSNIDQANKLQPSPGDIIRDAGKEVGVLDEAIDELKT